MNREVFRILESNPRASVKEIARVVKMQPGEVRKIIEQAEKERIILKYKTVINWDKLGEEQVLAIIRVKLTPQKEVGFDAIAEQISGYPEARTVYLISGASDLILLVSGKTNREIADFVSQKLAPIEGVQETDTQFLLRRYKEDGEIIDGSGEIKRQPMVI
jgi:DNA-binding Lrp family transcriptional regulator